MLYLLNTSILPNEGEYQFTKSSKKEVREILQVSDWTSAIGHPATASVMSNILGISIPTNRVEIRMEKGDVAVVFKLAHRLPEGKILSEKEIEEIGYNFYILKRVL